MSLKSWMAEFYPIPAELCPPEKALDHSLKKWEGLLHKNLKKHEVIFTSWGVTDWDYIGGNSYEELEIAASSCALCHQHYAATPAMEHCGTCPLARVRKGAPCDTWDEVVDGYVDDSNWERNTPWEDRHDKPVRMYNLLKRAKKMVEKERGK